MPRKRGSSLEPLHWGEELELYARVFLANNMFTVSNRQVGYMQQYIMSR